MKKNIRLSTTQKYTLLGIAFGLIFPIIGTILLVIFSGKEISWATLGELQATNPLLWIIDTAPIFLGGLAAFAGQRQSRLADLHAQLEGIVNERTKEIEDSYRVQEVLNSLLYIAMEPNSLEKQLEWSLKAIVSTPWLRMRAQAGIFLVDENNPDILKLTIQHHLNAPLLSLCNRVPFGQCLCGRAAQNKEIIFADGVDDRHEITYDGIEPHGHYNVPILMGEEILGVIVLYVEAGHQPGDHEIPFLKAVANILAGMIQQKKSEKRLRLQASVMQAAANSVVITDPQGTIEWVNPAFTLTSGYSYREAIGKKPRILKSDKHERVFYEDLWTTILGGDVWQGEIVNRRKNGEFYCEDMTITPVVDDNGEISNFVAIKQDITERKRAEEEILLQKQYFESLVQISPIAVVILDMQHCIVDCNAAFERLFGYQKEDALERNLDDLIVPETEFERAESYTYSVKEGNLVHGFAQRANKNGQLVDVEFFGVPVVVQGEQVAILALYHDISELVKARREAELAARAKAEFLANMSHEIRTPLNAIIGMTGLLLDTPLDIEQQDFANTVRSSGDALLTIINDILDYSKIEAGKMELEKQPFLVRESVENALDLVASKAAEKGLEIAYLLDGRVPGAIVGDITRVRQVLVNLLSNAVKFTDTGEVIVRVSSEVLPHNKLKVHYQVKDTGIGIPEDRMGRLFESFSQVDASTTRKYGGTGLGLAISKQLVGLMGGNIWAESVEGQGSTFHFTITSAAAPASFQADTFLPQPLMDGLKVLIVDDNATNRLILIRQTKSWGLDPRAAASGAEALEWIRSGEKFDFAILDMQMPDMDGAMLAAELRKKFDEETLPLILLTSLGGWEMVPKEIQFSARLNKPIKPSILHDTIMSVISSRAHESTVRQKATPVYDRELGVRHPLRILLAEDNLINQKVALRILEKLGYRADIAANGIEVLEALGRQKYDVVLMDVQMPEMDGLEATQCILEQYVERPRIIAMTANALEGDREAYLRQGMDDYVSKPIRVPELVAALERSETRGRDSGI